MNHNKPLLRKLLKEAGWLLLVPAAVVILQPVLLPGYFRLDPVVSINIHDTYIFLDRPVLYGALFPLACWLVYSIRFCIVKPGWIAAVSLLICGIGLIGVLHLLGSFLQVITYESKGWTVYPPLSALPVQVEESPLKYTLSHFASTIWWLQLLLYSIMLVLAFHFGKGIRSAQ